jgi:hypothetical protein
VRPIGATSPVSTRFCLSRGVASLPATPETVAAYLASEAESGLKPSTISRRCAAIRYAHKLAGHEPPTNSEAVKATLRGIRRSIGGAPVRKAPAVAEIMRDMAMPRRRAARACEIARCSYWASAGPSGAPNSWR